MNFQQVFIILPCFDVIKEKTTIKVFQGTVLVTPNGTRRGVEIKDNQMTSVVKGQKEIKIEKLELKPGESQPKIESGMSDSAKSEGAMNTSDTTAVNDTVAQGIMQASKADSANSKPHLPEIAVGNGDEDELETSEQNETVTSTASTSAKKEATLSKVLNFNVKFPSDGQVFSKTTIPVNGTVSPGATVTAASIRIPVTASGTFSGQVPIPNEDGEIDIEFEASLDGNTRNITRKIIYQPEYRFNLTAPKENQIVNSTSIQIKGEVLPAGAKVSVLGRSMNVLPNGIFSGTVQIPDEPGKVELDVEITFGLTTKNETRNIVYQKPADISRPEIQTVLPQISESNQISLAVYDRTADDEITLNYTVDGVNESEKGLPNSSFIVPLQAGTHTYTFQAVDKTGNSSQVVSQNIIWFGATDWMIKTNKTIDVLYLPPSGPGNDYEPVYTLEFSIENLPDNDMRLISLVTVVNKTTGESQTRKTFTDHYFTIDMKLKNHTTNMFDISIEDVRKKIKTRNVQVVIK
ncbi:MAG TPA: hypothetical protein VHO70_08465 [Chitinispirillaceae bacterium]|nr:hypothetical protein [Chitinispirillaceae bacterium]